MRNLILASSVCALLALPMGARAENPGVNLWTGEGVTVGRIFAPEISFLSAFGGSTAKDGELAVGHHDPDRDGVTIQNIEFSLAANLTSNIALIGYYVGKVDLDDHWDAEFEEYYARFRNLPLGASARVGRIFTKFGFHNSLHPHDFTFVDQFLVNGRLLGEDSATVQGLEVALPVFRKLPTGWSDRLTVSYGEVPSSDEEHGHGEEAEAAFEGEEAGFRRRVATIDYSMTVARSAATEHRFGVSAAWGRNGFDRQTQIYGLHWETIWRFGQESDGKALCSKGADNDHSAHGHEGHGHHHVGGHGGSFLRWRTEAMLRHFGAVAAEHDEHEESEEPSDHAEHDEHEEGGEYEEELAGAGTNRNRSFTDAGFYTALTYGFEGGKVQAHLRGDYVSGVAEAGMSERWRVSPAVSWQPSERLPISFVVQYNYDRSPSFGEEHSVWAQFRFNWGESGAHEH